MDNNQDVKVELDYIEDLTGELKTINIDERIIHEISSFENANPDEMLKSTGYANPEIVEYIIKTQKYKQDQIKKYGKREATDQEKIDATNSIEKDVLSLAISKNRKIIIILGLPGAGKSSALRKIKEIYHEDFYLVDSDEFKYGVEDKKGKIITKPFANESLEGVDVEYIHKASSQLARFILSVLIESGYNIALPKVGDDYDEIVALLTDLKDNNYKVYLHFVYTTVETALERNAKRFYEAKKNRKKIRLVPPTEIIKMGYKPLYTFLKSVSFEIVEDYMIWDGEHYSAPEVIYKK